MLYYGLNKCHIDCILCELWLFCRKQNMVFQPGNLALIGAYTCAINVLVTNIISKLLTGMTYHDS